MYRYPNKKCINELTRGINSEKRYKQKSTFWDIYQLEMAKRCKHYILKVEQERKQIPLKKSNDIINYVCRLIHAHERGSKKTIPTYLVILLLFLEYE